MEIQNNLSEIKWKKSEGESDFISLSEGEEVVGIYVGKEESERYPNTYNYKIDINGSGDIKKISGVVIAKHLDEAKVGTPVKIVYKGKRKNEKKIEYNDYEVYFPAQ